MTYERIFQLPHSNGGDEAIYSGRVEDDTLDTVLPEPTAPMAVARQMVSERYERSGELVLRHWRGGWWQWRTTHWEEREAGSVRADAYAYTEHAYYMQGETPKDWNPNTFKIRNLLEALAAITHLPEDVDQPSWLETDGPSVVSVANGLLDIADRRLLNHSPMFFNQTTVPFDYDPSAQAPQWLDFLGGDLWPSDPSSVDALGEFFGYVASGRLDLHKMLLLVGPTRGGKGTIARILGKMIGTKNVAGPTLSSLSYDFGMAPLIGKPLAVISDARLDAKANTSVVVERLLSISGEDTLTVNRKYRDQWTGKLPTRFLVISNELPRLGDASGTIANRFVALLLTNSWLGREDTGLEDRLTHELPGILNWAYEGLDRLIANGRFTRPQSTEETIATLQDLASPVSAFVRDRCKTGPLEEVAISTLFKAWKVWAEDNGHRPGSTQVFGRNLRSVIPGLKVTQPREGDERERVYRGVRLRVPGDGPSTDGNAGGNLDGSNENPASQSPTHNGKTRVPSRAKHSERAPRARERDHPEQSDSRSETASGTQWHAVQPNVSTTPHLVCDDYRAHQSQHYQTDGGWRCRICEREER